MKIPVPFPVIEDVPVCAPQETQEHMRKVGPGHAKGPSNTVSCLWKWLVMAFRRKHIRSDVSMKFSISSPFQAICGLRTSWAVAYICVISFNSSLETFASIHLLSCFLNFRYLKHPVAWFPQFNYLLCEKVDCLQPVAQSFHLVLFSVMRKS